VEPYVSERVSWAIRYHQAFRYFPDPEAGYEYPELYVQMFGRDYQPPEYLVAAHQYARGPPLVHHRSPPHLVRRLQF